MPAMKLTPNAAMRARDVSRPHAEHLAEAEAAEARPGRPGRLAEGSRARTAGPGRGDANAGRGAGSQGPNGPGTSAPGTNRPGTNNPGTNRAEITGERAAGAGDGRPGRAGFPRRRRRQRHGGRRGR